MEAPVSDHGLSLEQWNLINRSLSDFWKKSEGYDEETVRKVTMEWLEKSQLWKVKEWKVVISGNPRELNRKEVLSYFLRNRGMKVFPQGIELIYKEKDSIIRDLKIADERKILE